MTARTTLGHVLPVRLRPYLDRDNTSFWTGGEHDALMIHHCRSCGNWFHPPAPICRACRSRDVAPERVSGKGTVASYTVNVQPWLPGAEPYLIAWIELAEQRALRLMTNLIDVDAEDVHLDLPVEVVFEPHPDGDIWLPLFRPTTADLGTA